MTQKPIHIRGRVFTGLVKSTKMSKTAVVEWEGKTHIPKFERYEKTRKKVKAHIPEGMTIKDGDLVKISECRPLSKTKKFIILSKIGEEKLFQEKQMLREEAKKRTTEKAKEKEETEKGEEE